MKKSTVLALVVVGMMSLCACSNSDQSGYMKSSASEANAREAEAAEQEYADLAAQESSGDETTPIGKHMAVRKEKTDRKPASKEITKPVHVAQSGSKTSTWTVQLGAFKVKENAEKLTATLKKDGFPVVMRSLNHSKNGELYLVHLEPTPSKTEAEGWQTNLKTKSFDSTLTAHRE